MRPGSDDANLMQISKNQKFNVLGYIPNTWNTTLQLSRQIYKYQKGICIGSRHVRNADMNLTRKWEKLLKIIERVIFILVLNVQSLRQMYWNFIRDCMSILHWTDHELRLIADPPISSKTAKESVFFSKSVRKSVRRSVYARRACEARLKKPTFTVREEFKNVVELSKICSQLRPLCEFDTLGDWFRGRIARVIVCTCLRILTL